MTFVWKQCITTCVDRLLCHHCESCFILISWAADLEQLSTDLPYILLNFLTHSGYMLVGFRGLSTSNAQSLYHSDFITNEAIGD